MMKQIILLVLLFVFQPLVQASGLNLYSQASTMLAFQNQLEKSQVLMINQDSGPARVFDVAQNQIVIDQISVEPECRVATLVYAHPFLVDAEVTCWLDEAKQALRFLGKGPAPEGFFSTIYFHQDQLNFYFLINGRNFPHAKAGYIQVKAVAKQVDRELGQTQQSLIEILTQVKGYSGGVWLDQARGELYVTSANGINGNTLYKLSNEVVLKLIQAGQSANFHELAQKVHGPFPGLSMSLSSNGEDWLYNNRSIYGDNPSFILDRNDFQRQAILLPEACELIGTLTTHWLFNCDEHSLMSFESSEL